MKKNLLLALPSLNLLQQFGIAEFVKTMNLAPISLLFRARRPLAIGDIIMTVYVFAIQAIFGTVPRIFRHWSWSQCREEFGEGTEAKLYSTSSIVMIITLLRVLATSLCTSISYIFWRKLTSLGLTVRGMEQSAQTSAIITLAGPHGPANHGSHCAAIALNRPMHFAVMSGMSRRPKHKPMSEALAGYIDKRMFLRHIRAALILGVLAMSWQSRLMGQNVRFTAPIISVSASSPPYLVGNLPPASPTIQWCTSPANQVPCTNYSQTFQGNGTACPNGSQDTPDPNASTSACQPTADAWGTLGVWSPAGTFDYTYCISNNCFGPYTVTLGGSGGGGSGTVTTVNTASPLTGGPFSTTGTIGLAASGVTAGSYTNTDISVDAFGRVTVAANGSSSSGGNVSTTPAGNQIITQPASGTTLSNFGVNLFNGIPYVVPSYNWSRSPSANLSSPGVQSVTLTPCPIGIDTTASTAAPYGVYVATTGTPEAVAVTGGTCTSGAASGTITFTTVNAHSAGYTVNSGNSGWQEAINIATAQGGPNAKVVGQPAGGTTVPNYQIYWPIFTRGGKVYLDGYGSNMACNTRSVCLMVNNYAGSGGPATTVQGFLFNSNTNADGAHIANVTAAAGLYTVNTSTAHNLQTGDYAIVSYTTPAQTQEGRFQVTVTSAMQFTYNLGATTFGLSSGYGWVALENAAIEDNGQGTVLRDIKFGGGTGAFNQGIVIGNDQNLEIDAVSLVNGGVIKATANFVGNVIYIRGDQGMAAVPWIHHLEASLQCSGNGVRDTSGNTLKIADSVIQGFNQYGIYYANGLQPGSSDNVYEESTNCTNGFYPNSGGASQQSNAGYILNTQQSFTISNNAPTSATLPVFATGGSCATVQRNYYVVVHDTGSGLGTTPEFFFGSACPLTTGTSVPLAWPNPDLQNSGSRTFDILATVGTSVTQAPFGTGNYAVTGLVGITGTCSSSGICTATDTQSGFSSYTVPSNTWAPAIPFWPAAFVLGNSATLYIDTIGQSGPLISSSFLPHVFAKKCASFGNPYFYSPFWAVCPGGDSAFSNATVGAYMPRVSTGTGITGTINLTAGPGGATTPRQLITVVDGLPLSTFATPGYVRSGSVNDSFIGTDTTGNTGTQTMTFGAPAGHHFYVNDLGTSGNTWKFAVTSQGAGLPSGAAFNWNGDTGLSRDSAGVLDLGNGTQGSKSGSLNLTNLTVTGTCTGCGGSPLTTNGDLFIFGGGINTRLPFGSNGQFLFGSAGLPAWDTALSDNGSTLTYTGASGIQAIRATFNGAGAGLAGLTQGTDNAVNCAANSVCDEAPTSVATSYTTIRAAAGPGAPSVKTYTTLASGKTTESFTPTSSLVASVPFGNAFIAQSGNATIPLTNFTTAFTLNSGSSGGWTFNTSPSGTLFPVMTFVPTSGTTASGNPYLALATDATSASGFVSGFLVDMEGASQSGTTEGFLRMAGTTCTISVSSVGAMSGAGANNCINATELANVVYPNSYTSGGIPFASASGSIGGTALLAANVPIQGGGSGQPPTTGNGDFTIDATAHTLLSGAAGLVDFSAITGANGFKVPVKAASTVGANGAISFDSTNSQYHGFNNGVDSIFAALPVSVTPPNNDCVKWVKSGNNYALGDAGGCAGTPSLSTLAAAGGANTLANVTNQQNWNWALTGATGLGISFGETSAATGGTPGVQAIVNFATATNSTASPVTITQGSQTGTSGPPALNMTATWNNAALVGNMVTMAATNTSSATTSNFINFLGGASGTTQEAFIDSVGNYHTSGAVEAVLGSQALQICGGKCTSGTLGDAGGLLLNGIMNSNNGATAKAGYAILAGGGLTSATPNAAALQGPEQVASDYFKGASVTAVGDVVCATTTQYSVTDCTAGQLNVIGIAQTTTTPIGVVVYGKALVKFDGVVTLGDIACGPPTATGTTGQAHDNGTSACPSTSSTIGVIVADAGTITSFASGQTTAATAMSTTLALVQLHIAP